MTKQEAMSALLAGETLTHRYFDKDEWVKQEGAIMIFENGARLASHIFWSDRIGLGWEDGWNIFEVRESGIDPLTEIDDEEGEREYIRSQYNNGEHLSEDELMRGGLL